MRSDEHATEAVDVTDDIGDDTRVDVRDGVGGDTWFEELYDAARTPPEHGPLARARHRVRDWRPSSRARADAQATPGTPVHGGPRQPPGSRSRPEPARRGGDRGERRLWRDIVVTFGVFVAAVSVIAASLWIRDALTGRGDRTLASGPGPIPDTEPASPSDLAVDDSPTSVPDSTSPTVPSPSTTGLAEVAPAAVWFPVVERLAPGTSLDDAQQRADAVTSLGYPVEVLEAGELVGLDGEGLVLVGTARNDVDAARESCSGRALLTTCEPHRSAS